MQVQIDSITARIDSSPCVKFREYSNLILYFILYILLYFFIASLLLPTAFKNQININSKTTDLYGEKLTFLAGRVRVKWEPFSLPTSYKQVPASRNKRLKILVSDCFQW